MSVQQYLIFNLRLQVLIKVFEHLKPEFLKINPNHTIPTIDDNGFILWESRPIMTYLWNQYSTNDSLYPNDPKKRAEVEKMLHFDIGTLYKSIAEYILPMLLRGAPPDQEKEKVMRQKAKILDNILQKQPYVAGQNLSLADLSILAGITFPEVIDYDLVEFSNIQLWIKKMKVELPYYEEFITQPIEDFKTTKANK
ncbi:glutathione S-transferase 1-like [Limulus polyphemus]|uniref:Glutathione S-transferase 1-like n=1 Tax=Limulus polyphemus TaxID=6850 RepID=A0ABM1TB34_LIMPO|nr:glutathione S-transferase 1-like [Limulus polyphemus]